MVKKINIELSDKASQELEELRKQLDAKTMSEVIRASISLTRFLEKQKEKGNEIILRNKDTKEESRLVTLR